MDLDFIEIEHRENVMKVMEICGIDMQAAYELYMNSNCSVDVREKIYRLQLISNLE